MPWRCRSSKFSWSVPFWRLVLLYSFFLSFLVCLAHRHQRRLSHSNWNGLLRARLCSDILYTPPWWSVTNFDLCEQLEFYLIYACNSCLDCRDCRLLLYAFLCWLAIFSGEICHLLATTWVSFSLVLSLFSCEMWSSGSWLVFSSGILLISKELFIDILWLYTCWLCGRAAMQLADYNIQFTFLLAHPYIRAWHARTHKVSRYT
jgi:hypothetical protein